VDVVLDLDLDFFVTPTAHPIGGPDRRLDPLEYQSDTPEAIVNFLEQQCGLSAKRPIKGRQVERHDEAFWVWKEWIEGGVLNVPFRVIHVDGHADLGMGSWSWTYLMTEFLTLPLDQRTAPKIGPRGLNEGSYLLFALGARWIKELEYVFVPEEFEAFDASTCPAIAWKHIRPDGTEVVEEFRMSSREASETNFPGDLSHYIFKDWDVECGVIQLRAYKQEDFGHPMNAVPLSVEPDIPLKITKRRDFKANSAPTHILLAQSPNYTPASADALLPVIRRYFGNA
jgi:hypothetical protein